MLSFSSFFSSFSFSGTFISITKAIDYFSTLNGGTMSLSMRIDLTFTVTVTEFSSYLMTAVSSFAGIFMILVS